MNLKKVVCSFCGKGEDATREFFRGANATICDECVNLCQNIMERKRSAKPHKSVELKNILIPEEIHTALDKHVISQDYAKRVLSVAVYNHYKRVRFMDRGEGNVKLEKSNILLIGPTGTGKTLLARTLADVLDVPFAVADATSFTQAGYIGEDVEAILTRLLIAADNDVARAERGIVYLDEVDKLGRKEGYSSFNRDVSGEGVQQALLKIIEGTKAVVPKELGSKGGQAGHVSINTDHILFICGGSFEGLPKIIRRRLGGKVIGFGQEDVAREEKDDDILERVLPEDLVGFGLMPELVGRLPVATNLRELTREDLKRILFEPENALIKQYKELMWIDKVELAFTDQAIDSIVERTMNEGTGARGLRSILERIMLDVMYRIPSQRSLDRYIVTHEEVNKKLMRYHGNRVEDGEVVTDNAQTTKSEAAKASG